MAFNFNFNFNFKFISQISEVDSHLWNTLAGEDYPFTRFEFLHALEVSGAVGGNSGWQPHHLLIFEHDIMIGVMPCYLKYHSFGEYVFDHVWADAYERYSEKSRHYYPKLVTAIPFTPATGPRICISEGFENTVIMKALGDFMIDYCEREKLSSWHLLFPSEAVSANMETQFLPRKAVHFQWFNKGFASFDDFLATFSSRKRKNLKKERKQVNEQSITIEVFEGENIPADVWELFHHFYQMTYAKLSGHGGYLPKEFFIQLASAMPENLVLMLAKHSCEKGTEKYIAGALNFRDSTTLYGRYWGCIQEFKHLHFETCYYQGIEYCIRKGLSRFDPGVQGEHKIQRGFQPVYTYSNHWIADPVLREAIENFLKEEWVMVERYHHNASGYLPFKSE